MRVLFLTNIPSPYRVDFFNELGKFCTLTVLFERKTSIERSTEWHGCNYENFNAVFLKGLKKGANGAICLSVLKWLDKKKFDVFVVGGYSTPSGMLAIETLRLKGIPFYLNVDGGMVKKDKLVTRLIKEHLIGSASNWMSSGKKTNDYLKHYGAKEDEIYFYPFTSLFKHEILQLPIENNEKIKLRKKLGLNYNRLFLSVGQFIHRKGFDVLIKAFQRLKDENIGLVIIGGGEEREKYQTIIDESSVKNIHLIDYKRKKEILEYFDCGDVFILPTRWDIWGLVINEAMSRGLPVISTNKCVAADELVKNDINGYIVAVEDTYELYEKINILAYAKHEKLYEMGQSALDRIRDYTIENMAKRHIDIFEHI